MRAALKGCTQPQRAGRIWTLGARLLAALPHFLPFLEPHSLSSSLAPSGPAPPRSPAHLPAPGGPAPAALLSGPAAVAVALLLVGAVGRVPLELLRLVGQHHLHGLQRPGDGALLQCAAFLRGDEGPAQRRGPGGGWGARPHRSACGQHGGNADSGTRNYSNVVRNARSFFLSIPNLCSLHPRKISINNSISSRTLQER